MKFIEYINNLIHLGYTVSFRMQSLNAVICLSKECNQKCISKEQWLPISDHFYEKRIMECIDFMMDEIAKEAGY